MSGALTGLTRVRKFHQDDAHIFCREDQIGKEIDNCFEFLDHVYTIFGFKFTLELSTRPDNYIGHLELWNNAEAILEEQLNKFCQTKGTKGMKWDKNEGDGAFYGPKIDIHIEDALRRSHQCATIQLDFNLPQRFKLTYRDTKDKDQVPVIIHRAIYGSFERFLSILIEHLGGKWPLWLSPKQVAIVPVSEKFVDYGDEIKAILHKNKLYVDIDDSDNSVNKKIRMAQVSQYNYILVVGQNEVDNKSVNVRLRDGTQLGEMSVDQLMERVRDEISSFK
jgi:threonyl-tRNA synthetase